MSLSLENYTAGSPLGHVCRRCLRLMICIFLSSCTYAPTAIDDPEPPQRTGQCKVIKISEYEQILTGLAIGNQVRGDIGWNFAIFTKRSGDRQPKGPYQLVSLNFDKVDKLGAWGIISLNGTQVDAADTFFETSPGVYENLTQLMEFPSCAGRITNIQHRLLFEKNAHGR